MSLTAIAFGALAFGVLFVAWRTERLRTRMNDADARLDALDKATNGIADRLTQLRDELKNAGGLTDAQAARFDADIAKLQGLAADPTDVVPATPVTP